MKLPIIIDANGDIELYETIRDAETSIEAIDVKNNEYIIYDSCGMLLVPEVRKKSGFLGYEMVVISPSSIIRKDELKSKLINYLDYISNNANEHLQNRKVQFSEMNLNQLISEMIKLQNYR